VAAKTRGRASASSRSKKAGARTPMRQHLRPWARDALGIGLVVFALISVLALWFDAAGPVGSGIEWALRGAIGVAAVVFPVIALYWGILLLRGTAENDRVRMFLGFLIALVGVLGLLSIARGNPRPFGGYDRVDDAAGAIGALAAWPLGKLLSKIGAVIVLTGVTVLGLLIFTGTPLAAVGHRILGLFGREDEEGRRRGRGGVVRAAAAEPPSRRPRDRHGGRPARARAPRGARHG